MGVTILNPASMRYDGRVDASLRLIQSETGFLHRAGGSCHFVTGGTACIAGVIGPIQTNRKKEQIDKAALEVVFSPDHGSAGNAEVFNEWLIHQALEPVVLTALHPRTLVTVTLQSLCQDGSVLANAINSASLALLHAGVPMSGVLGAVCLAIATDGTILFDPIKREEETAVALLTLAFATHVDGPVFIHTLGCIQQDMYSKCIQEASLAVKSVHQSLQDSISKNLNHT